MGLLDRWLLFSVLWLCSTLGSIQNAQIPSTEAPAANDKPAASAEALIFEEQPRLVMKRINEFRKEQRSCDLVFILGEKRVPAHRLVLEAVSPFFEQEFAKHSEESGVLQVPVQDCAAEDLELFLDFCYTGVIPANVVGMQGLMKVADKFQSRLAVEAAGVHLKDRLTPSNCLGIAIFAEGLQLKELSQLAKQVVIREFSEVVKGEEFLKLDFTWLVDLLGTDGLVVDESVVFEAMLDWVKHNSSAREEFLLTLLNQIRPSELDAQVISKHAEDFPNNLQFLQFVVKALRRRDAPASQNHSAPLPLNIIAVGEPFVGNTTIEMYSDASREWTVIASLNYHRENFGTVWLEDRIIIAGGHNIHDETMTNSVLSVDLKTKAISNLAPMNEIRVAPSLVVFDGFVYAVGGNNRYDPLSSVERYNPKRNKWQSVAPMSEKRQFATLVPLNGLLYAIGGLDSSFKRLASMECYDPGTNSWTTKAPMTAAFSSLAITVVNGQIQVLGGYGDSKPRSVERYDPTTDTWAVVDTLDISDTMIPFLFHNDELFAYKPAHGSLHKCNLDTKEWKELATMKEIRIVSGFLTKQRSSH